MEMDAKHDSILDIEARSENSSTNIDGKGHKTVTDDKVIDVETCHKKGFKSNNYKVAASTNCSDNLGLSFQQMVGYLQEFKLPLHYQSLLFWLAYEVKTMILTFLNGDMCNSFSQCFLIEDKI